MSPCLYKALCLSLALPFTLSHASSGSFLGDALVRDHPVEDVLEYHPAKNSECITLPTGPIETTSCNYELIDSVNDELYSTLHNLVSTPFFKYFQLDLYRECPFWNDNGFCANRECAITTVDESEVPEKWRAAALSKIDIPSIGMRLPGCYYRDADFCYLDDLTEGDYFDLTQVPERFTGYAGLSAHKVWTSIYQENCFGLAEFNVMKRGSPAPVSLPDTLTDAMREEGNEPLEQCLEKRVYYKVVSGLHASISTHICMDYLNQSTGEWGPNLQCFINRVASHPERLQYIYFNTVLMLRAVARLGPYLSTYDYCSTGTSEDTTETLDALKRVVKAAQSVGKFDETVLFRGENANILKEEFKTHFRNVTRIMDCVGCDKCRLWGKVQTTGVATALKVLFELDEAALDPRTNPNLLSRAEIVALINTLHRFSESIHAVEEFRRMWEEASPEQNKELISNARSHLPSSTHGTSQQSQPSPAAGTNEDPAQLYDAIRLRILQWTKRCKQGTVDCLGIFFELVWRGGDIVKSFFRTSGKENGPGAFDEL